jgi:hypothetical protein
MNCTATLTPEVQPADTSRGPGPSREAGPRAGLPTRAQPPWWHHRAAPSGRAPRAGHDGVVAEGDRHDHRVELLCVGEAR